MRNSNYYEDNQDLQAIFEHFLDRESTVQNYEEGFRDYAEYQKTNNENLAMAPSSVDEAWEYYSELINTYGELAGKEMAQIAAECDHHGLKFEDGKVTHPEAAERVFHVFHDAGLPATGFSRRYGGLGISHTIKSLLQEVAYRADTSLSIATASVNLASILEVITDQSFCEEWIPKLIQGKYSATMGLSEPDFGSDLPNLRTKAELDGDTWRISGTKRYQTMACGMNGMPGVTLCLARTGKPGSGARGLSFFLVQSKDYEVIGLEHKLGLKASATCEVSYENSPGILLGEQGFGLVKYVMGMLNGARMSVACQGTGMTTAALMEAQDYAESRIQFGRPISEIPVISATLRKIRRDTNAMRLLMLEGARVVDMYHWRMMHLVQDGKTEREAKRDPQVARGELLANLFTPLAKYYVAEVSNKRIYDALQVFGGAGFVEDYDLARIYRDARIMPVYDGTSQIQVNAAIGPLLNGFTRGGWLKELLLSDLESMPSAEKGWFTELTEELEKLCELYVSYDKETREKIAVELIHTAAQTIASRQYFLAAAKIPGNLGQEFAEMAGEYLWDSLGEARLARHKVENPAMAPVAAG